MNFLSDISDSSLEPIFSSLRHILSCVGCGKPMTEAYRGTCAHTFCKVCFEGVNLAINKCMVCSAVCDSNEEAQVPLLSGFADAFARFDKFVTLIQDRTSDNSTINDPEIENNSSSVDVHDCIPSTIVHSETQHSPINFISHSPHSEDIMSTTLDQSVDILAYSQLHRKTYQISTREPIILSSVKSKKQRFLDEALDEPTVSNGKIDCKLESSHSNLPLQFHLTQGISAVTSTSTPSALHDGCSQPTNRSLSYTFSDMTHSTQKSLLGESQFPVTQNSILGRMVTDIDAIKKNIENLLEGAANNTTDVTFVDESSITEHNASINYIDEMTIASTQVVVNEYDVLSEALSQELIPLTQGTEKDLVDVKNDNVGEFAEAAHAHQEIIDLPQTLPLEQDVVSRASSLTNQAMVTAGILPTDAYYVTAICSNEEQVEMIETALQKGWIYDDLSREDLETEGFRSINILVCQCISRTNGHRLTHRTIPYMKALLMGYLIVDFSWLSDSIVGSELKNPYIYELTGTVLDKSSRVPLRARFLPRAENRGLSLLDDYSFYIVDEVLTSKIIWTKEDIETLIQLTGATVVRSPSGRSLGSISNRFFPLSLRLKHRKSQQTPTSLSGYAGSVISVSWLFDCICNLRPPIDVSDYLLPTK